MVEVGEDADIALCLIVSHVEPELIEGIGRGALGVEPNVATLRLAKLLAIGLRDERTGDTEGFYVVAQSAMDQLSTRRHIAPLVVATQLQPDAMLAVEMEKVVTLEELVGKLCKGKSVARRTVETLLHALLRHHIVDSDVLTHLAGKVEEGEVLHPVVVVDHLGLVGRRAVEVKKLGCLLLDGLLIVVERLGVKEIALRTFARRIANHTRSASDEKIRLVSTTLQMAQHHDAAEVSDMEGVCGRICAEIGRHGMFQKIFLCAWHDLCKHSTPFQLFNKILHRNCMRCI